MRRTGQDFPVRFVYRESRQVERDNIAGAAIPCEQSGRTVSPVALTGIPPLSGNQLIRSFLVRRARRYGDEVLRSDDRAERPVFPVTEVVTRRI